MSATENSAQEQLNEALSALVDGEASELEVRRLLKSDDADLQQKWNRYQLISSAMRKDLSGDLQIDLSASISAAIDEEPAHGVTKKEVSSKSWMNFGRFGIAASVAAAVVVGAQYMSVNSSINVAESAPSNAPSTIGAPELGTDTSVRAVGSEEASEPKKQQIIINEATQKQLEQIQGEVNRLMIEHAQNASQNTSQGVLPFVRVPDVEE